MRQPSRIKLFLFNLIFWTWCLPQSLVGLAIFLYVKVSGRLLEKSRFNYVCLVRSENLFLIGGISLVSLSLFPIEYLKRIRFFMSMDTLYRVICWGLCIYF